MISRRVSDISESTTVALSNLASRLKSEGKKIYNFGIGEPDFTTPDAEIEFAFQKAKEGFTHYTPSKGFPELRAGIARKVSGNGKYGITQNNVLVSPTKFAVNLSFLSTADPGDEIIIPEPYYLSYPEIAKIYGIKPVTVESNDDFSLNIDNIKSAITPKTRAVIISNPSNPTGKVFTPDQFKELQRLCIENKIYLITDQIYEELVFEGQVQDPLELDPELHNTIILSGFSKSHAMTGWRIGYMVASTDVINASDKFQQQTITCAPSISQMAALEALKDTDFVIKMKGTFEKRRDLMIQKLKEIPNIELVTPGGAFYVFPKYNLNMSSVEFSNIALQKKGLIITPGSAFGGQGEFHFRMSYATDMDTIKTGLELLKDLMNEMTEVR
ncbi:MAG: pyridoxal phosphate-dependent aminotransferase [Candidatus Thermoplasmatota archaeon]|nr:pyridoxal phosphate-dependent aminotransferase [Candidatus Thermoplasmatota archaeon]MCL5987829.1 pyridoxal phosphate-dependent aminotransferase [Candidatus Thermoplasmatota archaeon]